MTFIVSAPDKKTLYSGIRLGPDGNIITRTITGEVVEIGRRIMRNIPSNYIHGDIATGYLEEIPFKDNPITPYMHVYNGGVEIPNRIEGAAPVGSSQYCLLWEVGILFLDRTVAWGEITVDYYGMGANVNWERILIQDTEDGPGDASTNIGKYIRVDSTGEKHEYAGVGIDEVDGGHADSVYLVEEEIDSGGAD